LSDKEVASLLYKSYWTIKTQKKAIYQKLGISKDTELLWYMICERMGLEFSIKELREKGIELITR
jgi:DNA-binding NarL/FixJ family response regulator